LAEYTDAVVDAIGDRRDDLVIVAQSLGGFTAPLVTERVPVDLIVLVTAMIPRPGETGGEWWGNTGVRAAIDAQHLPDESDETLFTHDVPADVLAAAEPTRGQSGTPMEEVWPLAAWPDVPTRFLLCMDDRFFPPEWMRGVVRDRLGIEPDEIPGGHCAFLSQPKPLAAAILRAWHER
jgi:pimeloyl-ACP methyl ester carboxylesterase